MSFFKFMVLQALAVVAMCHTGLGAAEELRIELLETITSDYSYAQDVNDNGDVVGECDNFFFYRPSSGGIHFIDIPGYNLSNLKLNNKSQVIGSFHGRKGGYKAFLWDATNGLHILEAPNGGSVWVNDINDNGLVVGAYESEAGNSDSRHACLWKDLNLYDIGTLDLGQGAGNKSEATAVNNLGEIVGTSNYVIHIAGCRKMSSMMPFYWDGHINGSLVAIKVPHGSPSEINDNGSVLIARFVWSARSLGFYKLPVDGSRINNKEVVLLGGDYDRDNPIQIYKDGEVHKFEITGLPEGYSWIYCHGCGLNNSNQIAGYCVLNIIEGSHACVFTLSERL